MGDDLTEDLSRANQLATEAGRTVKHLTEKGRVPASELGQAPHKLAEAVELYRKHGLIEEDAEHGG